jgi:hypothetical protein
MSVRALSKLKNVLSKNKIGSNASSSNVLQGVGVVSASAPASPHSNSFHTVSSTTLFVLLCLCIYLYIPVGKL